jgi:hypothetical protein
MSGHLLAGREASALTVWRLLWALLGFAVRGRARQRVYVVLGEAAPHETREEFDARVWAITDVFTPYNRRDRFVVTTAEPASRR